MKRYFLYILCGIFLLALIGCVFHVCRLYAAVSYFQNRDDVNLVMYDELPLPLVIEFRGKFQDKDVQMLSWICSSRIYPLTQISFDGCEFCNTIPIPEMPTLTAFIIIGHNRLKPQVLIDETSLMNILKNKRLALTLVETDIPENLIKQMPRYSLKYLWLDMVPLTDEEFDSLFSLCETEGLLLRAIPVTAKTLKKIAREGKNLKEVKLLDLGFTEDDLKVLRLQNF